MAIPVFVKSIELAKKWGEYGESLLNNACVNAPIGAI